MQITLSHQELPLTSSESKIKHKYAPRAAPPTAFALLVIKLLKAITVSIPSAKRKVDSLSTWGTQAEETNAKTIPGT